MTIPFSKDKKDGFIMLAAEKHGFTMHFASGGRRTVPELGA